LRILKVQVLKSLETLQLSASMGSMAPSVVLCIARDSAMPEAGTIANWGCGVVLGKAVKGPISFNPMLMVPWGFAGGAARVGLGVEVGTGVKAGGCTAGAVVAAAGAVVANGTAVAAGPVAAAGAEVAAGAVVGLGVAVAAAPQAAMNSSSRTVEVNTIVLENLGQRRFIIRPPYSRVLDICVLCLRDNHGPADGDNSCLAVGRKTRTYRPPVV
jgi:hypothetical protein